MDERCENCDRKLNKQKIVWLELNQVTGIYHLIGEVAEEESQGAFAFGRDCAKTVLANGGLLPRDERS